MTQIQFKVLLMISLLSTPAMALSIGGAPRIPVAFVKNRGQVGARILYLARVPGYQAAFEAQGLVLSGKRTAVKITFAGTRPAPGRRIGIAATDPIGAHANYLRGNDARHWQSDLQLFGAIHYSGLWPGIELTYKVERNGLKAEYVVAPGAQVDRIRLAFDQPVQILENGTLAVKSDAGDFTESKPVLYQSIAGKRVNVEGGFEKHFDGSIGFRVETYDRNEPLVVDPSILFSGYFGGSVEDNITAVGIDSQNNIVVAGWTDSPDLPTSNSSFQSGYRGSVDAFVAAFLPDGGPMIYCTYLGGSGNDRALGLAIDSSRNVYITGWTQSSNFPTAGAFQAHLKGVRNAFVSKLTPTGNALLYSTYLGGSGADSGNAIVVDPTGAALVVGDTTSTNLPATSGVVQPTLKGSQDVFVAYLSSTGSGLQFLTYLGGSGVDHASSVVMGGNGNFMIGGYTDSSNFPTVAAFQPHSAGGQDGFVTKIMAAGNSLKFSTYLGGSGGAPEEVNGLIVQNGGNVCAAGTTPSSNFPVTAGAYQTVFGGGQSDGFVTCFSGTGSLLYSTFIGGSLSDGASAIKDDFHGYPYIMGYTDSQDFPVQRPSQSANAGSMDAFVVKMNMTLSAVTFGTYLGGSGSDGGNAIAVDGETSAVIVGQTGSGDFPVSGSLMNYMPSQLPSFITKIAPNFTIGVGYAYNGQMEFTADPWHVESYVSSTFYGNSTDIPIVGDWTGTGVKRIGIFRDGTWILDTNGNGVLDSGDKTVSFGQAGDVPVVGDWRGTGQIALGLYRQGAFILDLSGHLSGVSTGLSDATFAFGLSTDIPIAADWSGSGTTKVGIFRNGTWLVDYNGTQVQSKTYQYGQAGDIPVVGDWDSSGNPPKIGIYREGLWVLDYDGDHVWTVPGLNEMVLTFGFSGYTPLVF